jgi:hypothetical protein
MQQETELLVAAIKSLQSEPNYFKDYAFPIASAFFTSILGAAIAYFTLKHQEGLQIEKEKMDVTNKWTLNAEQAIANLFAIKANYHGELSGDPFQRLTAVPSVLFKEKPLSADIHGLSFIVPSSESAKGDTHKWSDILKVSALLSNYNNLLQQWEHRNMLNEQFKSSLFEKYKDKDRMILTPDEIGQAISHAYLVALIDINERTIGLTDDIILELDDFVTNFPEFAKLKIQVKRLKRYGSIHIHSNNGNPHIQQMLKKSPGPDFQILEQIFGEPEENIRKRFTTGYEH